MWKKQLFILASFLFTAIACQKDCVKYNRLEVVEFSFLPNSDNKGLFLSDVRNNGDTIRSIRNQFYITFSYKPYVQIKSTGSLFSSAYAKDCPTLDFPVTMFDPLLTTFTVNKDIDPSFWGISLDIIPAGTDLLSITEIRTRFLSDIRNNTSIHASINAPLTISKSFLSIFEDQTVKFTLNLSSKTGDIYTGIATAYVQVNA